MRILMIEDDRDLCYAVSYALKQNGYTVDICHEGDEGLRLMRQHAHELVILDRMLPALSGTQLLQAARSEGISVPVLMVTALGQIEERVEGLDAGADDYIVKPFAVEELLARIRAMQRRPKAFEAGGPLRFQNISLDPVEKVLRLESSHCTLSKRECDLMEFLIKNGGKTVPRAVLFSNVWGPDAPVEEGNLENYIHFLRRRLRSIGSSLVIKTVRGVGYCLEEADV